MIILKSTFLFIGLGLFACSESKFKGNNAKSEPVIQNKLPAQGQQPGCDLSREYASLENLSPSIQECENSGGFYSYPDEKCYSFSVPKSNCTLESIKSILISYSIPTQSIDRAIANNAKLLDCRQFPEVRTVAANFWFPTANQTDCTYSETLNIVTSCSRVLPAGVTSPTDEAERVRLCLNSL